MLKRIGLVLSSLLVLIFLERDLVKSSIISFFEDKYHCKLDRIKLLNFNELYINTILYKGITFNKVSLNFNYTGLDCVRIYSIDFPESGIAGVKNKKFNLQKNKTFDLAAGIFLPNYVYVKNIKYNKFIVKDIFARKRSKVFYSEFNVQHLSLNKSVKCNFVINFLDGELFFLCDLNAVKKKLYVKLNGNLRNFPNLSIQECAVLLDGRDLYKMQGDVDFDNLSAIFSNDLIKMKLRYTDKLLLEMNMLNYSLIGDIDQNTNQANLTINHDNEKLDIVFKDFVISGVSNRFMGVDNVAFVVRDGLFKGVSNLEKNKLDLAGNYSFSGDSLVVNLDTLNLKNEFGNGKILKPAKVLCNFFNVEVQVPIFAFNSKKIDFVSSLDYKSGVVEGKINVGKMQLLDNLSLSGQFNFSKYSNDPFLSITGFFKNQVIDMHLNTTEKGVVLDCLFYKTNSIKVYCPLIFLTENKLYKFSYPGTVVNCDLNLDIKSVLQQDYINGHLDTKLKFLVKEDETNDIQGLLKFKNGLITFHKYGVVLKNINIDLEGVKNKLKVIKGNLSDLMGGFGKLTGDITLLKDDIVPNIKLEMDNLCLSDDGALFLKGVGAVNLLGSLNTRVLINGSLNAVESCFKILGYQNDYKDIKVVHFYKNLKNKTLNPFCNLEFNVLIKCVNFEIIGAILNSRWSGNLRLCGKNQVSFSGQLNVTSGELRLFKNTFNISKGHIRFDEQYPFDPFLSLQASKNLIDVIVKINLSKSVSKVDFLITSIPATSMENILSKLLFNKTSGEMSPTDWAQVGYIVQSYNDGTIFSDINNVFTKAGISDIRFIKSNDDDKGTFSISKKLSEKLSVSVDNDIDEKSTFVKVQTDISNSVSLSASSRGDLGIGYKKRY